MHGPSLITPVSFSNLRRAGGKSLQPAIGGPGGGRGSALESILHSALGYSANHLFGNNITSAETFTWLHSPAFRATPLDMKAEVDLHFLIGVNQIIGHGWPYSAPQVGEPGWSLYAAAVFNDHNPWHPVMPDVARYIERTSFLLRQGQPANQVALLLPTDDAWASFSPGKVSVTAEMIGWSRPRSCRRSFRQAITWITWMPMRSTGLVFTTQCWSFLRPTASRWRRCARFSSTLLLEAKPSR